MTNNTCITEELFNTLLEEAKKTDWAKANFGKVETGKVSVEMTPVALMNAIMAYAKEHDEVQGEVAEVALKFFFRRAVDIARKLTPLARVRDIATKDVDFGLGTCPAGTDMTILMDVLGDVSSAVTDYFRGDADCAGTAFVNKRLSCRSGSEVLKASSPFTLTDHGLKTAKAISNGEKLDGLRARNASSLTSSCVSVDDACGDEEGSTFGDIISSGVDETADEALTDASARAILEMLSDILSELEYEVYEKRIVEEWSYEEIGENLRITKTRVETIFRSAKKKISNASEKFESFR